MATTIYYLSSYASLSAAISAIGSSSATLGLDTASSLSANFTIPSNVETIGTYSGIIAINGYTLTINGPFSAGLEKIFDCSTSGSNVVFHPDSCETLKPHWWGASPSSSDNSAAINAAITSAKTTGGGNLYTPSITMPGRTVLRCFHDRVL